MSLTLGEKLRQAREARGISISEVAEQTRISALYLESIENNDYRPLPGGIFNRGFVKSYAKYVGLDEREALQDYHTLVTEQTEGGDGEPQVYRPEVLTDDHSRSSLLPTVIFAVVILGLMVWAILALKSWNENRQNQAVVIDNTNKPNTNSQPLTNVNTNPTPVVSLTGDLKVEVKALNGPLAVTSLTDAKKAYTNVAPGKPATFEPKQSLTLSYSKNQAANIQLTLNGKQINLPSQPENSKRNAIEVTITKDTAAQIYQSGAIASAAPDAIANRSTRP